MQRVISSAEISGPMLLWKTTRLGSAKRLAEAGLVDRATDPLDGRAELVLVSRLGLQRLGEVRDALARRLADRLDDWPADDVRRATELVDALVERLLDPPASHATIDQISEDPA